MSFTTSEILLLIIIVSIILVLFVLLTIIDIKEYLKSKNKNVVTKKIKIEPQEIESVEVEKEEVTPIYEINKKNVEIIDTKKEENRDIIEDSEIIFEEENKDPFYEEEDVIVPIEEEISYKDVIEVPEVKEEISKVSDKIPAEKDESLLDTITSFEMEQEENAIISLDELMKVSDKLYEGNEPTQYDDGDEPITISEVIARYNEVNNKRNNVQEIKASDTIKDTSKELEISDEEDFLTDLEAAHKNINRYN